ncbi:hemolysin XhlA family protein [Clostridium sp. BSD9I1]|uniref:hemolysin XhlA family protein n=1 Tax=Clostridium sp. BSD9I1 TaxID=2003589 RepID=UPI001649576B|nr:hemolysin XhlA family protein [Clostridium sp. BSD9I1]
MADLEIIQEIRERLIKIEATLENNFKMSDLRIKELENRIGKLESTYSWLWRTVAGSIILGVLGAVIKFS